MITRCKYHLVMALTLNNRYNLITKPYKEGVLDGVVKYANIQKKYPLSYFVQSFASSETFGKKDNAINFSSDSHWESGDESNRYYTLYFPFSGVSISGYGITSNSKGNGDFPRSWNVDVSNDNSKWIQISFIPESTIFTEHDQTKTFQLEYPGYYHYFKFTQNGKSNSGNIYFCFKHIDIFGSFSMPFFYTCESSSHFHISYISIIILN